MKFLSITISRKLFFIFIINSIITVTISGMVIFSFLGLSSQFNFNSELSTYKSTLDSIRIEQSKLKGHAQSFYLNVTDLTVKDGLQDISDSLVFIRESLEKLKSDKNKTINSSSLASMHRFNLNDQQLSAIESLKAKYGAAKSAEVYDAELTELKKKLKNQLRPHQQKKQKPKRRLRLNQLRHLQHPHLRRFPTHLTIKQVFVVLMPRLQCVDLLVI